MRSVFRDPELNRRFHEDSYVVVPFLTAAEVISLRASFDELHPQQLGGFYPSIMRDNIEAKRKSIAVIRRACDAKVAELLDGYGIYIATFLSKAPTHDSAVPMHVEPSFLDEREFTCVSVWCALEDADGLNGALLAVPGSEHHAFPVRPIGGIGHPFSNVMPLMTAKYARTIEMAAGEAIIFSHRLLHGSGPNSSGRRRLAVGCGVKRKEAQVLLPLPATAKQVEVFEIDEAFFVEKSAWNAAPPGSKSRGVFDCGFVQFTENDVLQSSHLRPIAIDHN